MASSVQREVSVEYLPLFKVREARSNPKGHDLQALAASLRTHGFVTPLVLDEKTKRLVAGHGRLEALRAMQDEGEPPPKGIRVDGGTWLVPVVRGVSFPNPAAAEAYLLADNRITELGAWDDAALLSMLQEMQAADLLEASAFTDDDILALLDNALGGPLIEDGRDPDVIPEVPKKAKTKLGDIYLLDDHRIMCGDSRDPSDVARLIDRPINLAFTSPPYASQREYDQASGFMPVPPDEYVEWFAPVASTIAKHLAPDGSWFVNIKEHCEDGQRVLYVKDLTLTHVREWGWRFVDEFAWTKAGVPGRWNNRFKNGWEPLFHFARQPAIKFNPTSVAHASEDVVDYSPDNPKTHSGFLSDNVKGRHSGMALPNNVLQIGSARSEDKTHTAEFPVALPQFFVNAYTDEGDAVYDPFMGSGSTLLAAERTGRAGYGMEISPRYCDVIVQRWEEFTGEKALRAPA